MNAVLKADLSGSLAVVLAILAGSWIVGRFIYIEFGIMLLVAAFLVPVSLYLWRSRVRESAALIGSGWTLLASLLFGLLMWGIDFKMGFVSLPTGEGSPGMLTFNNPAAALFSFAFVPCLTAVSLGSLVRRYIFHRLGAVGS